MKTRTRKPQPLVWLYLEMGPVRRSRLNKVRGLVPPPEEEAAELAVCPVRHSEETAGCGQELSTPDTDPGGL